MKTGSKYEKKFIMEMRKNLGIFGLLRKGWPDFLVIKPNGKIFCVEVKRGRCLLKPHQKRIFDLLNANGIPCYISRNGKLNKEIIEELDSG